MDSSALLATLVPHGRAHARDALDFEARLRIHLLQGGGESGAMAVLGLHLDDLLVRPDHALEDRGDFAEAAVREDLGKGLRRGPRHGGNGLGELADALRRDARSGVDFAHGEALAVAEGHLVAANEVDAEDAVQWKKVATSPMATTHQEKMKAGRA
jgi:hypothetical protein